MEKEPETEWGEAQKIIISVDLVVAAKQQLQFLAAVDRNRYLYEGPALDKAIYRYKYFWLPLLAKHVESKVVEGPLVVPLDCEWIWHCHRLNPVRYKIDCVKLYGRILDNKNVASSVTGVCRKKSEAIWNQMYPTEPYELNKMDGIRENIVSKAPFSSTNYDLVSAVKRQSSFFYQVSRPNMRDDTYLEGAVARYKGFLHLIKRNIEKNKRSFCVPLYDIDLIWHSHQLNPVSYCKDLVRTIGHVLEHDDTDSDRSKGKKLDVGFSETTKQWEETFGSRYWRAGAMYTGSTPSPLSINLSQLDKMSKIHDTPTSDQYHDIVSPHKKMLVEVMLEVVEIRNLPEEHKGSLCVSFTKKHPDFHFRTWKRLNINPSSKEKDIATFKCEPNGDLVFQLMSLSSSNLPSKKSPKLLGTTSINLQDLLNPISTLSVEKWFELVPNSEVAMDGKFTSMRIAFSLTNPFPAPYAFQIIAQNDQNWTRVVDEDSNEVMRIQMRGVEGRQNCLAKKEVIGMTLAGESQVLAEFRRTEWHLMNSRLQLQKKCIDFNQHVFVLKGSDKKVVLFPGRKLEYETKCIDEKQKDEHNFMSCVEFSTEHPNGKAIALLNLNSGWLEMKEKWMVMPGIILGFILADHTSPKEIGNDGKENESICISDCIVESCRCSGSCTGKCGNESTGHAHCGGACGGGCGTCGGTCGGRCRGGGCGGGRCGGHNAAAN